MSIEGIKSVGMTYNNQMPITPIKPVEAPTSTTETAAASKEAAEAASVADKFVISEDRNDNGSESEYDNRASIDAVKRAISEINKHTVNKTVQFGIHEKTNRITIRILDKDTKELIREYPAEKSLDLIAKTLELAGILVDEKR